MHPDPHAGGTVHPQQALDARKRSFACAPRLAIDPDFTRLYDIPVVAGRMLSENRGEDRFTGGPDPANEGHSVVINEAAAARFGFTPQQMVNKTILLNISHVHIVGVLRDFMFRGAREPVKPAVYIYDPKALGMISVRIRPQDLQDTLAFIDKTWRSLAANTAPADVLSG